MNLETLFPHLDPIKLRLLLGLIAPILGFLAIVASTWCIETVWNRLTFRRRVAHSSPVPLRSPILGVRVITGGNSGLLSKVDHAA